MKILNKVVNWKTVGDLKRGEARLLPLGVLKGGAKFQKELRQISQRSIASLIALLRCSLAKCE